MTSHNYFTAICMILTFAVSLWRGDSRQFWLSAGFFASCIGDLFLANKHGRLSFFVGGVAAFSVAHALFFTYARSFGHRPCWWLGGLALAIVCGWPVLPVVLHSGWQIGVCVCVYAAFSCATLAASTGMCLPWPEKSLFVTGVLLLIFSDAMIAQGDFLKMAWSRKLIIPTYVASHAFMLLSWLTIIVRSLMKR